MSRAKQFLAAAVWIVGAALTAAGIGLLVYAGELAEDDDPEDEWPT